MTPRFVVRESEGFSINLPIMPTGGSYHYKPVLEVMVMDTAYGWHVIASWPRTKRNKREAVRAAAERRCAELNAWAEAA